MLIPPEVKNFVWRVVHNCLPTPDNLQRRQVEVNSQCSICMAGEETLNHAIRTCPFARRCWKKTSLDTQTFDGQSTAWRLAVVFENWTNNDVEIFNMVAWSMWAHKNSVVWHDTFQTP